MATSTVSAKYQVVIPKELRKQLNIKPGQKVQLSSNKSGDIVIQTDSQVDQLYGSMRGAWGKHSDKYINAQRAAANRDRT